MKIGNVFVSSLGRGGIAQDNCQDVIFLRDGVVYKGSRCQMVTRIMIGLV